jgi:predicted phosphodiesterase
MKIGIVSDIHAHPRALRRTLEDMPSVDMVLCAGDVISEYRFCAETVDLLRQARVHCIQGNHETGFFGGRNPDYLRKCQREFAPELLDFVSPRVPGVRGHGCESAHGPRQPVGAI